MEDVSKHFDNMAITQNEEKAFLELFERAMSQITNGQISELDIVNGIESVIDNFRRGPSNACARKNFKTFGDLCGFFYYLSPLSACVARHRTMTALKNCEKFRLCFHLKSLKIISIGGGTGSDLVGLFSAIFEDSGFQDLEVVIADYNRKYERFENVVKELLRQGDFGNASRLVKEKRITTSFRCVDLTTSMSTECEEALENSHIVWMKGFLSVLKNDPERHATTERIISAMTPGALLVVIDSPSYYAFDDFIQRKVLREIFQQNEGQYFLRPVSVPKYRIAKSTNQEIYIFEKIKKKNSSG